MGLGMCSWGFVSCGLLGFGCAFKETLTGKQTASGITLQDLNLKAGETGIVMYSVARIRLLRVFIDVEVHTGSKNNCAVLVVNAYWIQMEQSHFTGPARKFGDQPVVVLRGDVSRRHAFVYSTSNPNHAH